MVKDAEARNKFLHTPLDAIQYGDFAGSAASAQGNPANHGTKEVLLNFYVNFLWRLHY